MARLIGSRYDGGMTTDGETAPLAFFLAETESRLDELEAEADLVLVTPDTRDDAKALVDRLKAMQRRLGNLAKETERRIVATIPYNPDEGRSETVEIQGSAYRASYDGWSWKGLDDRSPNAATKDGTKAATRADFLRVLHDMKLADKKTGEVLDDEGKVLRVASLDAGKARTLLRENDVDASEWIEPSGSLKLREVR